MREKEALFYDHLLQLHARLAPSRLAQPPELSDISDLKELFDYLIRKNDYLDFYVAFYNINNRRNELTA